MNNILRKSVTDCINVWQSNNFFCYISNLISNLLIFPYYSSHFANDKTQGYAESHGHDNLPHCACFPQSPSVALYHLLIGDDFKP